MQCPFPGMDPYLERPAMWPDFHNSLITEFRRTLQPALRPRFGALSENRLYVVQHERPIIPDVSILETGRSAGTGGGTAVLTAVSDDPVVVEIVGEEIREPYLAIVHPGGDNRLVTAIEVLSPTNKRQGPGRDSYLEKQAEYRDGGANLVEIDLLRDGRPTFEFSEDTRRRLGDWRYIVLVTRRETATREIYCFPLKSRLPRFKIPLTPDAADVVLDLAVPFQQAWESGPYPEFLRYDEPPPGELREDELEWCRRIANDAVDSKPSGDNGAA